MPFKSKKQWKWAFANHEVWADEWAHKTKSYKSLPNKKGRKKKK